VVNRNRAHIEVSGDASGAERALGSVESRANRLSGSLKSMRLPLLAAAGAVAGLGFKSVQAASDLDESMNAVRVVFQSAADTVLTFGVDSARAVGLSTAAFNQLAAETGALLVDTGIPLQQVASDTNDLAVRAADMASVFNTDVTDALSAINQALRGETEAIRRYTGDVTDATLQQFALAHAIAQPVKEMTQQEKRLLRLQVVMSQTSRFAGDFANTSESVANQMRIMQATTTNASASLGQGLLPITEKLTAALTSVAESFGGLSDKTQTTILVVGAVVGAVALFLLVLPPLIAGIALVTTGVGFLSAALTAMQLSALGPIGLAILALIGVFVLLIQNWELVKDVAEKVFVAIAGRVEWMVNHVIDSLNFLIRGLNKLSSIFGKTFEEIPPLVFDAQAAFDTFSEGITNGIDFIKDKAGEFADAFKASGDVTVDTMQREEQAAVDMAGTIESALDTVTGSTLAFNRKFRAAVQDSLDNQREAMEEFSQIYQDGVDKEIAERERNFRHQNRVFEAQLANAKTVADEEQRLANQTADAKVSAQARIDHAMGIRKDRARIDERTELRSQIGGSLTPVDALQAISELVQVRAEVTASQRGQGQGGRATGGIDIGGRISSLLGMGDNAQTMTDLQAIAQLFSRGMGSAELLGAADVFGNFIGSGMDAGHHTQEFAQRGFSGSGATTQIIVQGDVYGFDEFEERVGQANLRLIARGA